MTGTSERWTPKPLSALKNHTGELPWVWENYVAKGSITLVVGLWKAGKTTLLAWLFKALGPDGDGEFGGFAVKSSRILVITEESETMWRSRRDKLGLGDHIEVISRPFLGRADWAMWRAFVQHVAELTAERKFDLVVFDTLPNLWPVDDENDNAKAITALTPLLAITEAGAAVLASGHPRKGDASEGQAMRGAGATPGFVDIIVEMRRYDAKSDSTRRTLRAYSRYEETPDEIVLDFDPESGYCGVGTKADARSSDRLVVACRVLPNNAPGMTADELRAAWPADAGVPRPALRTLQLDLKHGQETAGLVRTGDGKRADPYRYYSGVDSFPASSHSGEGRAQESPPDSIHASSNATEGRAGIECAALASIGVAPTDDDALPVQYPEYMSLDGRGYEPDPRERRVVALSTRREARARRGVR